MAVVVAVLQALEGARERPEPPGSNLPPSMDAMCPHCGARFEPPVMLGSNRTYLAPCCAKLVTCEAWRDPHTPRRLHPQPPYKCDPRQLAIPGLQPTPNPHPGNARERPRS
jgi:hypothetical protein